MRIYRSAVALALVAAACSSDKPTAPSSDIADPDRAVFVTSDISHFWQAYDNGGVDGASAAFQTVYLNQASAGLKDFIASRNVTAGSLVTMVKTYPRYFAAIRAPSLSLANDAAVQGRIRENYRKIKSLYPPAIFPPVTFLIGRFSTGG